ncbi:MAG: hypothetical protein HC840_14965 [Leptolyngbyaceae cyanobacterium RM2_2_4]|nr:hypothetical protein [Leptolyngbyaceae cyanobacterium RM2_2_4]
MTQPRLWKNLPAPLRLLLRPWAIVSVGLHVLVLLLPLPDRSTSEPPLAEEPCANYPTSCLSRTYSPFSCGTVVTPRTATSRRPQRFPRGSRPTAPPPDSPIPSPQSSPSPTPQANPSPPSPTPSPQNTLSEQQSPSPSPAPGPPPAPEVTSFAAEIPHAVVGGEPGCGGQENCWQTQDTQWRSVATTLRQELESKGYEVEQETGEEELNFRVYEVSKDGEIEYLNLLSTAQGTFYVLADQPMTRDELEQLTEAPNS